MNLCREIARFTEYRSVLLSLCSGFPLKTESVHMKKNIPRPYKGWGFFAI